MRKKVIVVGAGRWGINHIRTLIDLDSLYGVVEPNEEAQLELKHKFPDIMIYSCLDDSFDDNPDGYVVATPPETHFEIGEKIINNKISLLIEKPLTLSSKSSKELVDLAKKNNVNLMVGHVLLFHPAIIKIKSLIEDGLLGDLKYLYSNRLNLGVIRSNENVFWSLASHDISVFKYLINLNPDRCTSSGKSFLQEGVNDIMIVNFEYKNNIKAHIFTSWANPFKEHRLVIIGSKGMLSFEDSSADKSIFLYKNYYKLNFNDIVETMMPKGELIDYDKSLKPLTNELKYFIENLDKKFMISNGDIGLNVVKILEGI